jgi:hypothetical protein
MAGASWAQTSAVDDVEANTVEELVVRGRLPGPAWWRVSDADSIVYVLGMPDALPRGMTWNQSILNRRLQGANRLITPPVYQASANPLAVPKLLLDVRSASRSKAALDEDLPPALARRLERAAVRAGKSPDHFQATSPWFAGVRLAGQFRKHVGLETREPLRSVVRAARLAKVPTKPAFVVQAKARTLVDELKGASGRIGRTCVEAAVDEVEAGDALVRNAATAWAAGDVRVALGAPRSSEICFAALPGAGADKRTALGRQADAIAAALGQPGHSVAVLTLRSVLARDGVLDQLRERGFTVRTPE